MLRFVIQKLHCQSVLSSKGTIFKNECFYNHDHITLSFCVAVLFTLWLKLGTITRHQNKLYEKLCHNLPKKIVFKIKGGTNYNIILTLRPTVLGFLKAYVRYNKNTVQWVKSSAKCDVQSHFLCEVKFFIQNRYSMKIYYSLLSYALVTLNNVVNVNYFRRHIF